ncbi:MAG TPA: hypothetical protein VFU88_11030 [Ktedonobacterales bacterium]|nr:hypothetical protein [Ktedonobacterales bacterium]
MDGIRQLGPRQARRLALTFLSAGMVALALVGLLALTQPDPWASVGSYLHLPTATPTPTIPLGGSIFFVQHEVPWGKLTVDGQPNTATDLAQAAYLSQTEFSFILDRGKHTIVYEAPPFTTLKCTVSVPASSKDTCPLAAPSAEGRQYVQGAARVIELGATLDHLPTAPRAALDVAAQAAVAITTKPVRVAAGERYMGADGMIQTAAQDMRATLFREAWSGLPLDSADGCVFLCDTGTEVSVDAWMLTAEVREGYRYTTADGQVVAEGPLMLAGKPDQPGPATLAQPDSLQVRWNGAWQVLLSPAPVPVPQGDTDKLPLSCQAGSILLANRLFGGASAGVLPTLLRPLPAANPADGCIVGFEDISDNGAIAAQIVLLYRFGLLLATDDASHARLPDLPMATAAEQALAHQIMASH